MDGLTEGGKKLLKECLEDTSWGKSCQFVIERHLTERDFTWEVKGGIHHLDFGAGVTLDDYKLIKATLMVQGKWTA